MPAAKGKKRRKSVSEEAAAPAPAPAPSPLRAQSPSAAAAAGKGNSKKGKSPKRSKSPKQQTGGGGGGGGTPGGKRPGKSPNRTPAKSPGKPAQKAGSPKAAAPCRRLVAHRCTAVDWMPSGVTALDFNESHDSLAVGRENGAVEIWSVASWHCAKRMVSADASAAESVCWTPDGCVLSAGLQGAVTIWDLASERPHAIVDSYGGAVWAMAFEKARSLLAIGCEDGCVRVFDYDSSVPRDGFTPTSTLTYKYALSRFDGRALCVGWQHGGGAVFAGGSDGTIRRWAVPEEATAPPGCDQIISTSTGGDDVEPTAIWSLATTADDTVITGDSAGFTKFWDGRYGTLIQEFKAHG